VAKEMELPKSYVFKILQALRRAGLVHTQRGKQGGVSLAREPAEISMLNVVDAVDPIQRVDTCPLGRKLPRTKLCPLHQRLDNALEGVETAFGQTTLAQILAEIETAVAKSTRRKARPKRRK
jgi:Rrf2 family protein